MTRPSVPAAAAETGLIPPPEAAVARRGRAVPMPLGVTRPVRGRAGAAAMEASAEAVREMTRPGPPQRPPTRVTAPAGVGARTTALRAASVVRATGVGTASFPGA